MISLALLLLVAAVISVQGQKLAAAEERTALQFKAADDRHDPRSQRISLSMAASDHAHEHQRPFDPAHDIFVFGSNESGHHAAGAAAYAVQHAGAKMGEGVGRTGKAYAIVTMSGLPRLREEVSHFTEYARINPALSFFVTRVGCGIAGYEDNAIAPLFKDAPANCLLPLGWRDYAELRDGLEPSAKVY